MHLGAIRSVRTKPECIVNADFSGIMRHKLADSVIRINETLSAEASFEVWTLFVTQCVSVSILLVHACGILGVEVCTLISFLALLVLHEVSAWGDPLLIIYVEELALVSLLALVRHPMNAHCLLDLALVLFRHLRIVDSLQLIPTLDLITLTCYDSTVC